MSRIHLSRADITAVEEGLVLEALRSGWVAPLGPMVERFERDIADRAGVSGALALSSGTAALHLALLAEGAGPGSVVVLPSMTFAASANAVLYTGAEPVFVDSGPDANVDPDLLLAAVDTLRSEGRTVACVLSVDLFGRCADYGRLSSRTGTPRRRIGRGCRRGARRLSRGTTGRLVRPQRGALVQRQQDHDNVRWRHAAQRRRRTAGPCPVPVNAGAQTCAVVRTHRDGVQLQDVEHPGRPRRRSTLTTRRDDGPPTHAPRALSGRAR